MHNRKVRNRSEPKKDIPFQSMPNLSLEPYCESESSLNPYALEFVPSYMKSAEINSKNKQSYTQKMKTATTSTTTLTQRGLPCGDASYLQAQRQLFELMHQLGEKLMPLKAINVSLSPDGQGINVQFKAEHGSTGKRMLDESLCQDAALHLELSNRSSISRRLPNVLAANFMARMGEVLKDKMEWNENSQKTTAQKLQETKRKFHSSSVGKAIHHVDQIDISTTTALVNDKFTTNQLTSFSRLCNANTPQRTTYSTNLMPGTSSAQQEPKFEKKLIGEILTPRKGLGHGTKECLTGVQKRVPRSTFTSQMRQLQIRKRLSLQKPSNNN